MIDALVPDTLDRLSAVALATILFACAAGGIVKGVLGIGLPLVAVPIMAIVVPTPTAIALIVAPILGTNLLQAIQGRRIRETLVRFRRLIAALFLFGVLGVAALGNLPTAGAAVVLGAAVIAFAVSQLAKIRLTVTPAQEPKALPIVGAVSGLLGGMTGFYGPPMVMLLVAMGLAPNVFVATIGTLYTTAGLWVFGNMLVQGLFAADALWASALMLVPTFLGTEIGRRLRPHLPVEVFRKVILVVLVAIGINLILRGLGIIS